MVFYSHTNHENRVWTWRRFYSDINGGKRRANCSRWCIRMVCLTSSFGLLSYHINHHHYKFPAVVPPYLDIVFSVCLNSPFWDCHWWIVEKENSLSVTLTPYQVTGVSECIKHHGRRFRKVLFTIFAVQYVETCPKHYNDSLLPNFKY